MKLASDLLAVVQDIVTEHLGAYITNINQGYLYNLGSHTLYLNIEQDCEADKFTDDVGDVWVIARLNVSAAFSSCTMQPNEIAEFAQIVKAVAAAIAKISEVNADYGTSYIKMATAEQVAENARKTAERAAETARQVARTNLEAFVKNATKHWRIGKGQSLNFPFALPGDTVVELGEKKYTVVKMSSRADCNIFISRIA